MIYKVITKNKKGKTLVSDHRLKSRAEAYKRMILRARKMGKLPKDLSVRLIKVKK